MQPVQNACPQPSICTPPLEEAPTLFLEFEGVTDEAVECFAEVAKSCCDDFRGSKMQQKRERPRLRTRSWHSEVANRREIEA